MFTDRVIIKFSAGKGGNGVVAWRREKYIPKGGPVGGNGGKGGSIIIRTDVQLPSLESLRNKRIVRAEDGKQGGSSLMRGKNGKDLIVTVPAGTLVKDPKTGRILYDLTENGQEIVLCKGGFGGRGNHCFKSPTNQAPNICTPGKPGQEKEIELELKLIADVGLVGFPNAGKSTFLSAVTSVPVKIGAYPFTTLKPNLAFVRKGHESLLIADIPGIIEGASRNKGLGLEFLRHIERTRVLLFIVDCSSWEGRKPWEDLAVLQNELHSYDPALLSKPSLVLLNKMDREEAPELAAEFRTHYPDLDPLEIVAADGTGLKEVLERLFVISQEIK